MNVGKAAFRVLVGVLIFLGAAGAIGLGGYLWLRASRPPEAGVLTAPGLAGEVEIDRDADGVPHIHAKTLDDAFFALGFAQAEDRLFQMDLLRRYGEGRVSEIAGGVGLKLDRFMRILGFETAAERQWRAISPSTQRVLEAYAAGVNAYIARRAAGEKPLYLVLPGPAPWRPVDSLVVGLVMSFNLSQNYRRELLHARIAERVGPGGLKALFPQYVPSGATPLTARIVLYRLLPLEQLGALTPRASAQPEASNDWVVDGRHSTTGAPILENDPHVALTAPSTWYLASVEGGGVDLTGAFLPGEPFMVLGHNAHVGWGLTETGGDVEDLFVEKVDPANPSLYLTPHGWRPFAVRQERVGVRWGRPVTLDVRLTSHGPVISDAVKGQAKAPYAVSFDANFLQGGDLTPQALWEMDEAQDWPAFRAALRDYGAPEVSIAYADTGGTIAFVAAGRVPVRKGGDGWAPTPGWTGEGDWTGFIPFDALPQSVDPPSGKLLSANNDIAARGYPYFLSHGWAPPFRADRIAERLAARPRQSVDSISAMTADTISPAARQLVPLLLRAKPEDGREAAAQKALAGWNGDMAADLPQPLIFTAWMRRLERDLFQAKLGGDFADYWSAKPLILAPMLEGPLGCRPGSACAPVVARALGEALADLRRRYGDDPSRWRWGEAHRAVFENLILGRAPLIGGLISPSTLAGGGAFTIDAGDMNFADRKTPFGDDLGPGLRMVLDFSDLANSRFLLAPGESENVVSTHYADLLERWRAFRWMIPARARPVRRLLLKPG